jgi:hypothetical protein
MTGSDATSNNESPHTTMEESLLQKANRIMMSFKPCTVAFRDGSTLKCDRITKVGVTIVGETLGSVTVVSSGRVEELVADYITDITQ